MLVDSLPVRFRPFTLNNIIGQEFSVDSLKGSLLREKMSKTFLLSGPPGTGKTTVGRMINTYINCQTRGKTPIDICLTDARKLETGKICDSCRMVINKSHPDLREVNGANHRKIEDIRQLIEDSGYSASFNARVFLIDECHQIMPQGIQALLKHLEEPGEKTIWVLATMKQENLDDALIRRCTPLPFKEVSRNVLAQYLQRIAEIEGFQLKDRAINWIYSMCSGRPGLALTLLDALMNINANKYSKVIEDVSEESTSTLVESGLMGSQPLAIVILSLLYIKNPMVFAFLQRGVSNQLLQDMYYLQDNFVAHMAYGGKAWKWDEALKVVKSVLKKEINLHSYSLPIAMHIKLTALLGKAVIQSRQYGDAGVALRQAISEWWLISDSIAMDQGETS